MVKIIYGTIIVCVLSIVLTLVFCDLLQDRVEVVIGLFSRFSLGMSKEDCHVIASDIPRIRGDLLLQEQEEIRFPWPYSHRPQAYLTIVFQDSTLAAIYLDTADARIEWKRIEGYLEQYSESTIIAFFDFLFIFTVSHTIFVIGCMIQGRHAFLVTKYIILYMLSSLIVLIVLSTIARVPNCPSWL